MLKNFHETVRLQSEKRKKWIREIRGESLQGIANDASSAHRLVSSSAASFPGRNECAGTHCSLIEEDEREYSPARSAAEFEVKGKIEETTRWQGHNESHIKGEKRSSRLVGAAETSKVRVGWRRLQRKILNMLDRLRRKELPHCHRESSWQVRQSRPCQKKGTEPSVQSTRL